MWVTHALDTSCLTLLVVAAVADYVILRLIISIFRSTISLCYGVPLAFL